ncbi:MAG: ABC transporter permease [Candidatus Cloacimonetes bacterium]|nr:ABC transporter permease [Candidatus Cloacimonadota bacterium]
MLKNYLKIAYRHIARNKFYSAINIIGLAIGITCALLIGLYVQHQYSYDSFHKDSDRIYRVESMFTVQGKLDKFALTAFPLVHTMKAEIPEIEEATRLQFMQNRLFKHGENKIYEDDAYLADSTFFDIFSYEFIHGDPKTALSEPFTAVLTESFADKLFGDIHPIGETIVGGNGLTFQVTGVIEDIPDNSHVQFQLLTSMTTLRELIGAEQYNSTATNGFWNISVYSYIRLNDKTNPQAVMDKFQQFYDKYMKELGDRINTSMTIRLTPVRDTHFIGDLQYDFPTGNTSYTLIFIFVAMFILLIACINYMNLATARSMNRAREVGIRKVAGAPKGLLIRQFLSESVFLSFISLIIAVIAAYILIPTFSHISGVDISFNIGQNPLLLIYILIATIIVGLISGSYPSFYLSSFKPVTVLKGKLKSGKGSGGLRKVLVLIQFSITIIMLIGTFAVSNQLSYIQKKDLGFDKEDVLVLTLQDTSAVRNMEAVRDAMGNHPDILSSAITTSVPGRMTGKLIMRVEAEDGFTEKPLNLFVTDTKFIDLMGMEIVEGRNFSDSLATDREKAVIINEAAAKEMNWSDGALGKRIYLGLRDDGTAFFSGEVVGVVKDFNYQSLHNKVAPITIFTTDFPKTSVVIKYNPENIQDVLTYVRETWQDFMPEFPFEYEFLDDVLNEFYIPEQKLAKIFTIFAFISILIACLGLFGLASYTTEQRTREIGIRKVLGATSQTIVMLLSKTFTKWVLLANIIAWPVAYFALKSWLENFAYRTQLSVLTFILSGLIALAIAILTVLYQSLKASRTNPSITLKYE